METNLTCSQLIKFSYITKENTPAINQLVCFAIFFLFTFLLILRSFTYVLFIFRIQTINIAFLTSTRSTVPSRTPNTVLHKTYFLKTIVYTVVALYFHLHTSQFEDLDKIDDSASITLVNLFL